MRLLRSCALLCLLLAMLSVTPRASAQAGERCFPETQQCVGGRFREYWEGSGGLPVFGFPVAPAAPELNRDTQQTYPTQWFERNRFELHAENAAPYDVLLGRLGDDRLRQLGVDWRSLPQADSSAPHRFAQTGHAIAFAPFWSYWSGHGLELGDRGVSERESLALFGLPLTEPRQETNPNGDTVLTQWFERARFEYHPDKPEPFKVLLGLLGKESRMGSAPPIPIPEPIPVVYTALGDSLAVGVLASRSYVERYREGLEADARLAAKLTNLGRSGWTSADLLAALKSDEQVRSAVRGANVVSWNIGGNDLIRARSSYKARACGGDDNQSCLRSTAATLRANWDAIVSEILALRNSQNTLLVTLDLYNPYVAEDQTSRTWSGASAANDFSIFEPYFRETNAYIAATAAARGVRVARVSLAFNGTSGAEDPRAKGYIAFDGLHPNDAGHEVIANSLRGLGYAPLR